jgi:hypothetical protein
MMTRIMQIASAIGLPTTGKGKILEYCFDNERLDEWERSAEKGETICLASIFGGASIG